MQGSPSKCEGKKLREDSLSQCGLESPGLRRWEQHAWLSSWESLEWERQVWVSQNVCRFILVELPLLIALGIGTGDFWLERGNFISSGQGSQTFSSLAFRLHQRVTLANSHQLPGGHYSFVFWKTGRESDTPNSHSVWRWWSDIFLLETSGLPGSGPGWGPSIVSGLRFIHERLELAKRKRRE